jgi:hypothetical protein
MHVDYKHSRIKQYHKESRALRTETTINDARDFDVRKRLKNLPRLREVGFGANRRLLEIQRLSCDRALGDTAFAQMQRPSASTPSSPLSISSLQIRQGESPHELDSSTPDSVAQAGLAVLA